jgi:hypothetical protein
MFKQQTGVLTAKKLISTGRKNDESKWKVWPATENTYSAQEALETASSTPSQFPKRRGR